MKELPKKDMIEGKEASRRFDALVSKILSVPREEIERRIEKHRKEVAANPKKRGPKTTKKST
jgi:hypothetical protein